MKFVLVILALLTNFGRGGLFITWLLSSEIAIRIIQQKINKIDTFEHKIVKIQNLMQKVTQEGAIISLSC